MEQNVIKENNMRPISGFLMLFLIIMGLIGATALCVIATMYLIDEQLMWGWIMWGLGILGWTVFCIMPKGLKVIQPNEAQIFTLFGSYHGTVKTAGFYYVNPFCSTFSPAYGESKIETTQKTKDAVKQGGGSIVAVHKPKSVSLKKQTLDNGRQKVNDILGNPIIIGAIVIWYVENPTKAVFAVENYREYLSTQTDSTIRNVSRLYPYDVFSDDENDDGIREKTLRGSALEIADTMRIELQKRVDNAGLVIDEVRITHLAYAEEIAAAMLQRQQASAIIAARQKIVDGAVGMVKMAIDKLSEDNIILLDDERKAAMVSNLLVVLCGNRDAQPVINSGTIY